MNDLGKTCLKCIYDTCNVTILTKGEFFSSEPSQGCAHVAEIWSMYRRQHTVQVKRNVL